MTCELIKRRDDGHAPPWDSIIRTEGWDLVHAYDTSLEGWLVLVARRHVTAVSQMSEGEAQELGPLIAKVSAALEAITGCERTYIVQFAEHPEHRHVHLHVIPRAADLRPDQISYRIFDRLGVDEEHRISETAMNKLAYKLRSAPTLTTYRPET